MAFLTATFQGYRFGETLDNEQHAIAYADVRGRRLLLAASRSSGAYTVYTVDSNGNGWLHSSYSDKKEAETEWLALINMAFL